LPQEQRLIFLLEVAEETTNNNLLLTQVGEMVAEEMEMVRTHRLLQELQILAAAEVEK
jgi:hypothetical protein